MKKFQLDDHARMVKVAQISTQKAKTLGYEESQRMPLRTQYALNKDIMKENPQLKPKMPPFFGK